MESLPPSIISLPPEEQSKRLFRLFIEKTLDTFIEDCEKLIANNVELSSLNKYINNRFDFNNEYR